MVQDYWREIGACFKTPTVIKYDDSYTTVESWGLPALAKRPIGRRRLLEPSPRPIELFKLHLLKRSFRDSGEAILPDGLDYKRVIKDYLEKLGADVVRTVGNHWLTLDFYSQVIIVLTVKKQKKELAISFL
ncbi:13180_t:CDS:1 [Acaulospora colombiana]|uniref:13180_t:CDS:1 n=1 Tax=Acaulospora colombiana TaxID=27376 RepID=A0ACA9L2W7_9GLOM|nr:13180_t:CDS:1 [Acaulospora colombiana]